MKRLIASELQRIIRSRRTQLLLVFYIIMLILSCAFRYFSPAGSYDGINYNVRLNSLNFSPFAFYEIRIELLYIILPILFLSSIHYEKSIGAFRMYVTRPYEKHEFIISKWIALAITTFIIIIIAFVICTTFGYLFMPKATTVKFYNISHSFSVLQAFLYNLVFFILQFFILLCVLALASAIGMILDNSILSIVAVIAALVGLGHYTKLFEFLNNTTKYGFYVLSGTAPVSFYVSFADILIGGFLISALLWQKKDYLC